MRGFVILPKRAMYEAGMPVQLIPHVNSSKYFIWLLISFQKVTNLSNQKIHYVDVVVLVLWSAIKVVLVFVKFALTVDYILIR